uniref:Uncharacterized protein n=1 Tax=Arundo donax TaxID=35708 RepID=A0A0A9ABF9_ARUDO
MSNMISVRNLKTGSMHKNLFLSCRCL